MNISASIKHMLLSYSHLFHKNLGSRHKFVPIQGFIQDFVFGERYGRW